MSVIYCHFFFLSFFSPLSFFKAFKATGKRKSLGGESLHHDKANCTTNPINWSSPQHLTVDQTNDQRDTPQTVDITVSVDDTNGGIGKSLVAQLNNTSPILVTVYVQGILRSGRSRSRCYGFISSTFKEIHVLFVHIQGLYRTFCLSAFRILYVRVVDALDTRHSVRSCSKFSGSSSCQIKFILLLGTSLSVQQQS